MIVSVPTSARPQQRYDHGLRRPVHRTGDMTVGTDHRRPPLDGAGVAARGADRRVPSACGGPHGAGAPTEGPGAALTRPEAQAPLRLASVRETPNVEAGGCVRRRRTTISRRTVVTLSSEWRKSH
jgi:hypothetical protein